MPTKICTNTNIRGGILPTLPRYDAVACRLSGISEIGFFGKIRFLLEV
ncbi:hypothetical protein QUF75_18515 [Desulfococcaceae bacterium HSG7]|nr:hypothetical protein [Desulfococcaceae bacterium HSG7]